MQKPKTTIKRKVSKFTKIPTTSSGRKRKAQKAVTSGGCLISVLLIFIVLFSIIAIGCSNRKTYYTSETSTITREIETKQRPTTSKATEKPTEITTTEKQTEVPTEKPTEQPKEENDYELEIVDYTTSVEAGSEASVTIQGKPETEYSISVFYHSGPSNAEGLETKTSDSDGKVTWTWKVGNKTAKDTYDISISGDGKHETIEFTVI